MAHLWIRLSEEWAVLRLVSPAYDLTACPPVSATGPRSSPVELIHVDGDWVIFAEPTFGVLVNGLAVGANIHVLEDRDEIMVHGERLYYSTESLAEVEEYSGRALRCPRCKLEITGGQIVRCPNAKCNAVHHKDCWTYAPQCSLCPNPTELEAGFQWTPEAL